MGKIVFVLSGGGAKGSFQVGVLKKLTEKGIIPDVIYGTSVGALNAAGYSYIGIDKLEEIWLKIKRNSDIIKFQLGTIFFTTKGLYSTAPLRSLLESFIQGTPSIKTTPVVCVNNLYTGSVVYIDPLTCPRYGMTFVDAVLASASMPLAMEPVNDVWVDGGVRETVPLRIAIDEGAVDIYVICCSPWKRNSEASKEIKNWLNVGARTLDILTHEIFINDIQCCLRTNDVKGKRRVNLHLYAPNETFIDTLDFKPEKIRIGISKGYTACELDHGFICSV
jgi:predicted acylesterase/phospholipase RssA